MIQILKGSERKVADIPIERPPDVSAQAVRLPVGTYGGYGDEGYGYNGNSSGPSFFEFLFGGGPRYYQPRNPVRPRGFVGRPHASNGSYFPRR
jgi:hypothetical protein